MRPTRREFLWATGAAAAGLAWYQAQGITWTADQAAAAGWEPGIERRLASACLLCPARCGIRGRIVDGRLVGIIGNPLHPISRGGVCPRGIAGVQVLYHPERLRAPRIRTGARGAGGWRTLSAAGAVTLIADRLGALRESGRPEGLALLAGYCEGTMHDLWRQFLRAFGSPNYVADDYRDGIETVMSLMHGIPHRPAYDLERSGLVLSFGAPLFEAWWSPLQAYVAYGGPSDDHRDRPHPRFVQVDTRFSRTAAHAQEWIGIRPGTYATLALGIAYVVLKEELFDAEFVARHVTGFEDRVDATGRRREGYRSRILRQYRTEEVSAATGVPVERIVTLAKAFVERQPAVAVIGAEVLQAPDGLLAGLAVHSLNVLMGSVNRPGGVLFPDDPPLTPLAAPVLDATARAGVARPAISGAAAPFGDGDPARRFAQALAEAAAPPEVLLTYYANPLASSANSGLWTQALSRIPFIVSFSPFLDETARYADVILPDALPYERWQDAPGPASYPYPTWGLTRPLVAAPEEALHTGDALLAVARRLGGSVARSLPDASVEELLKARAHGLFTARRGMTLGDEFERTHYRQMEERGWWLAEHTDFEAFWNDLVERGGWTDLFYDDADPARLARNPGGRIDLMPKRLQDALDAAGGGRALYAFSAPPTGAPTAEFPLRLMPYRVSTLASGTLSLEPWLAEQPTLFPDQHWVPWVEVHPATAGRLGLEDGAMVWVRASRGQYRARVKIFPGTAPDQVGAPYGLRHPGGELANPLQLLDGATDPLTGVACWFTTFVSLERAPAERVT